MLILLDAHTRISHFIRQIGKKQSKYKGFYGLRGIAEKKGTKGNSKEKR